MIHCLECGKEKEVEDRDTKRGRGKFCSRSCSSTYNGRTEKISNATCSGCSKEFYKTPSSKNNSRSGLYFCCRECKDKAQRIGGIEDIQPNHYNTGESNYRVKAYREYEIKCNRCGYDEHPEILEVHHKDKNRKNNDIKNLEVLCPNCHKIEHMINSKTKSKCKQ